MTSDRVMAVLQDLGKHARDSEEGYRQSAENADDADLKTQFRQLARERAEMAEELDRLIRQRGGEPSPRGSMLGAMHRSFADLKAALTGGNRQAILREVARGENAAEAGYDAALGEELPAEVRDVVERQHVRVRETRDRYRWLAGQDRGISRRARELAAERTGQAEHFVQQRPVVSAMTVLVLGIVIGATVAASMMGNRQNHRGRYRHAH